MDVLVAIGVVVTNILIILYLVSTWTFSFWRKRKVPFVKPLPLLGNYGEYLLMKKHPGIVAQEICQQFPDEPLVGTFYGTEPVLIVQDPELLKLIFTKDFYYFSGRELSQHMHKEVVTRSFFFAKEDEWKVVRQNLTPLFSSAKMKNMFYLVKKCTNTLEELLDHETNLSEVLEAKSLMAKYTMDCICTCAFGVDGNVMAIGTANNPFQMMATEIFKPTKFNGVKVAVRSMWPGIFYALGMRLFAKMITDFFTQLLKDVFASRDYKPSDRNDFVDSILAFNNESHIVGDSLSNNKTGGNKKVSVKVDDEFLVSQCVLFFGAGFETSSSAMSFTLYELAKNQKAQQKVLQEVDEYLRQQDGKVEYNCITELPYLDACVQESTRLYPVFGVLAREVTEDYTFPSGLQLEKGCRIHIPMLHLHKNPKFFPEPEQYKPERFLPGAADEVKPYTFIPFGEGPRTCIGMRFAKMTVMSGLITVLKKYRVELTADMPTTLELDPKIILTQAVNDIQLKFIKR